MVVEGVEVIGGNVSCTASRLGVKGLLLTGVEVEVVVEVEVEMEVDVAWSSVLESVSGD